MGITGPPPKKNKVRANADTFSGQERTVTFIKGDIPELPDLGGADEWHPRTFVWWEAIQNFPVAQELWMQVDWEFALGTAFLHSSYWWEPTASKAAELRQREIVMGFTTEARLKQRITTLTADQMEAKAPAKPLTDARSRKQPLRAVGS